MTDIVKDLADEITNELRPLLAGYEDKVAMAEWLANEYSRYMMVSSDDYITSANKSI